MGSNGFSRFLTMFLLEGVVIFILYQVMAYNMKQRWEKDCPCAERYENSTNVKQKRTDSDISSNNIMNEYGNQNVKQEANIKSTQDNLVEDREEGNRMSNVDFSAPGKWAGSLEGNLDGKGGTMEKWQDERLTHQDFAKSYRGVYGNFSDKEEIQPKKDLQQNSDSKNIPNSLDTKEKINEQNQNKEIEEKTFYGIVPIRKGEKWGFCDQNKNIVIPCKYDDAKSFSEGLAAVKWNKKWGYIDDKGKVVIPFKYDDAYSFREGLAKVKKNWKWGFIDKKGKEIIFYKYDDAWSFNEGMAAVKSNGKWGFIDKWGRQVIPCKYDYAENFQNGKAKVWLGEKSGYVDKYGREYWNE